MKKTGRIAGGLLASAVLIFSFVVSALAYQQSFEKMGIVKPRSEKPAPGFSLQDIHGNTVDLGDFSGKPILLNFWATWCEACKEELPSMQRLYETMKEQGVEVVAISIDRSNFDRIREYVEKVQAHLSHPAGPGPESPQELLHHGTADHLSHRRRRQAERLCLGRAGLGQPRFHSGDAILKAVNSDAWL